MFGKRNFSPYSIWVLISKFKSHDCLNLLLHFWAVSIVPNDIIKIGLDSLKYQHRHMMRPKQIHHDCCHKPLNYKKKKKKRIYMAAAVSFLSRFVN